MRKVLIGAALAATVLVPAASASSPHRVRLALVPLRKPALGSAARGLALARAGPVSNTDAASRTPDGTRAKLAKLGRINGYALEYGNAFSGAADLTDVHTGVEQYRSAADARRGLAFWQKEDSKLATLDQPGFAVTSTLVDVPAIGKRDFAYLTSYSASNIAPVSGLDEKVADGRYVLDVIVTAGTASIAEALAPKLARKLDTRLRLALKGGLHAKRVKLPKLTAGPPPGGPDLTRLALKASDLVGKASVDKHYVADPSALSDYSVLMLPAGPFDLLDQEIEWYPSANEASFFADFDHAAALASPGTTALDLGSLGDGARGSITQSSTLGAGLVVFASGNLLEVLFVEAKTIDADALTSLAQIAASRIDAAGLGG